MPSFAEAVINFRILPGETMESVKKRIEKIAGRTGAKISDHNVWPPNDPIPAPGEDTPAFTAVKDTVRQVFPGLFRLLFL